MNCLIIMFPPLHFHTGEICLEWTLKRRTFFLKTIYLKDIWEVAEGGISTASCMPPSSTPIYDLILLAVTVSHPSPRAGPSAGVLTCCNRGTVLLPGWDTQTLLCCRVVSQPAPVIHWGSLRAPWLTLTNRLTRGLRAPGSSTGKRCLCYEGLQTNGRRLWTRCSFF